LALSDRKVWLVRGAAMGLQQTAIAPIQELLSTALLRAIKASMQQTIGWSIRRLFR